jgi:ribokinase
LKLYVTGRLNYDTVIQIGAPLERGRKYVGSVVAEGFGGTGANIAVAATRAGAGEVYLLAAVGEDLAEKAIAFLRGEGVNTRYVKVFREATGRAFILIDSSGESTIVTLPGANNLLAPEHIPKDIGEASGIVVANASLSVAKSIVTQATDAQVIFMDPGTLWNPFELGKEVRGECFILPNKHEFNQHTSFTSVDEHCITIVKKGIEGAVAYVYQKKRAIAVSSLPLEELGMKIVSTSGCGDVFTGVFSVIYLESRSLEKALLYASIAAGLKATKPLSYDSPKRVELEKAVEKLSKCIAIHEYSL